MANAVSPSSVKAVASASSPFSELLRRSRFASFDPYVRQTYVAPQSYAQRGNYGLKRSINLTQKNSAISLKSFDERASYTNWTPAESNARFIRQFDELHVNPRPAPNKPWANYIGTQNQLHWLIDSESSPGEGLTYGPPPQPDTLGKGGRYGASRADPVEHTAISVPNLTAMKPRQFRTFVKRLRDARPEFREYMNQLADAPRERYERLQKKHEEGEKLTNSEIDFLDRYRDASQQPLLGLAQNPALDHRARFLGERTRAEFEDQSKHKIEQQPHRVAGLNYAHPTPLETLAYTRPRPGFILQPQSSKQGSNAAEGLAANYIAGFAGMTAQLRSTNAPGKQPLLRQASRYDRTLQPVLDRAQLAQSMSLMRIIPGAVRLSRPPRVVGKTTQDIEQGVDLQAVVTANVDPAREFRVGNSNTPGSPAYVAARGAAEDLQAEIAARHASIDFVSRDEGREVSRIGEFEDMENPLVPNQTATRKLNVEQWLELAESLAEAENPLERALVLLGEEGAARSMDRAQRVAEYELNALVPTLDSDGVAELAELAETVQESAETTSPEFTGVLAQAILAELSEMYTPALVAAVLEGKETGAGLVKSMHALVEEAPVESEGMLTKDAEARVRTMLREFLEQEAQVAESVEELFETEEDVEDVDEGDWVPRAFPTAGASTAPRTPSQSWSTAGFLGARPLEQNTKEKNSAMSVLEQLSRDFGKKR